MKKYLLLNLVAIAILSCSKSNDDELPPPEIEKPKIEFSKSSVEFSYNPTETQEVTVISDYEWYYEIENSRYFYNSPYNSSEWLSIERVGSKLIMSAAKNYNRAWNRIADIKIRTFGEIEYAATLSIYQDAYYLTLEGINDILSTVDNVYISEYEKQDDDGNSYTQRVFNYTGEDYPFSIDVTLTTKFRNTNYLNMRWFELSGNNKTNLKLDGIIYITDYYNNNHVKILNEGSFEINVIGSEYNTVFSHKTE